MIQMKIVDINTLKLNPNNVKTHYKRSIDSLKKSILEFQQYMPIVVNKRDNIILVGNGTYQALKQLKYKTVKVIYVDLDELQASKLEILDNRTSQLSEINQQIVEKIFYELNENLIKITGYTSDEVNKIMNELTQQSLDDQTEKVNLEKITCPYCKTQFTIEN